MMTPWHLDETYGLVKAALGRAQESLVRESTRSVLDRQAFARYHYHEALRLSKSFERTYLTRNLMIDTGTQPGESEMHSNGTLSKPARTRRPPRRASTRFPIYWRTLSTSQQVRTSVQTLCLSARLLSRQ
jgi:hypothetical protein